MYFLHKKQYILLWHSLSRQIGSADLTFRLGGYPQRRWTLSRPVSVVGHHAEGIFGVWHEVLNGDLHFSWTTGVHYPLPIQIRETSYETETGADCWFVGSKLLLLFCSRKQLIQNCIININKNNMRLKIIATNEQNTIINSIHN